MSDIPPRFPASDLKCDGCQNRVDRRYIRYDKMGERSWGALCADCRRVPVKTQIWNYLIRRLPL